MARARALALAGALALALTLRSLGAAAQAQSAGVTPAPLSVRQEAGAALVLRGGATIAAPGADASARWTAAYLRDMARRSRGLALSVGPAAHAAILLRRGGDFGAEGYRLQTGGGHATVTASTDAGLFYGAVTLWRLITADGGRGAATLAPAVIDDKPRFAWRGLLLDSARHFQSPAFVERLIDRMARDKLNVLHWHLTDDQGWRIEIRRYPRLTGVGGWRAGVDPATGRRLRYGGFYTQSQIRRIVAYAAARHVTIVPEIEMPGHSLSAILAYPELGAAPADAKTQGDWGIFPSILDPSDGTYRFMTGVLTEVMALFPGPWINVGGDEAVKDEWRASPQIQAQIKRLGLKDEEALQGWFTARIGRFLAAHGRKLIGWDDILKGGGDLPADAAVVSWHLGGAAEAAAAGHDAVIATDPTFYLDHRQGAFASEPPGRGPVVSLADVYRYEPTPPDMPAAERGHIIGVEANLWTEHMPTERDVALMAFPRADALAEIGWTAPKRKDWDDFARRETAELARDKALGLPADDEAARAAEDAAALLQHPGRLASQQLSSCAAGLTLNLAAPLARQGGPYLVDIMNPCWIYPQADLGAARRIEVAVTRLPFNFQIGADVAKIPLPAPRSPAGELEIRVDGCAGAPALSLPLAAAARSQGVTVLTGELPALPGRHDLCLSFTRRSVDPMWVVGWAEAGR
ncbi:MAG TPA: beta-N-acetylhexosaminidase [Caulobacteraceae bacterium]